MVAGPSQPSMSIAPPPSPPQPLRPNLDDQVVRLKEWMRRMDATWPYPPAPQPPADPPVPGGNDKQVAEGDVDLG
ncbi:UNVERIFIED_CONTAM: hypothetical protein Sangu_3063100 [Sesamum angustifolium]|uniref:Uncharacterized protein n=1 Tax=Sesamum angustifolium TaxID=2727405 RepID=A0AAW2KEP9_9LAMI